MAGNQTPTYNSSTGVYTDSHGNGSDGSYTVENPDGSTYNDKYGVSWKDEDGGYHGMFTGYSQPD